MTLEFSNITKSYNKLAIIKNVSGSVKRGEVTTLIGPSGSGKSTLLRLLSLIEYPDYGTLKSNGIEYNFSNGKFKIPDNYWPKVTLVFQQLYLWPHLTMMGNIMLPHLNSIDKNTGFNHKLKELIDFFGSFPK